MIEIIFPKGYKRYLSLPIFGSILDEFAIWQKQRGYATATVRSQLKQLKRVDRFLWRHGTKCLDEVSHQVFRKTYEYYHQHYPLMAGTVRHIEFFFTKTHKLDDPIPKVSLPIDIKLDQYTKYLNNVRGLTYITIHSHCRYVKKFLEYIGYGNNTTVLAKLSLKDVDHFFIQCCHRLKRDSLQHVVAYVRSFLRFQYEQGTLPHALHTMIDTPRVYRFEKLPRYLPWDTIQKLLDSVDCSTAYGIRDYTILFLASYYGMRSCEIVGLTLDDIDWRNSAIRIQQRKTSNSLMLPLTDRAAEVLIRYLRQGRPNLPYRQLFLRVRAPHGLLKPTAVTEVFQRRALLSGLDIPYQGPHCIRHSYAIHLLHLGESIKVIGDLLGHRSPESTCVYIRLSIEDLRAVSLPVPHSNTMEELEIISPLLKKNYVLIDNNKTHARYSASDHLRSFLAEEIMCFIQMKQSLGRSYLNEDRTLHSFDAFLAENYPTAQEMTGTIFERWAETLIDLSPTVRRARMLVIRNFCLYCCRSKPDMFVPDELTFPVNHPKFIPYIFTEQDIARLINATQYLPNHHGSPLRARTMRLAIILLYTSGLRRGELLRLKLEDFNLSQSTIRIESTKFHKSRIIPLSPSVAEEMKTYLDLRSQTGLPMELACALIWNKRGGMQGKRYSDNGFRTLWISLCSSAKVLNPKGNPPRLHDLRHSFAVNVLRNWYRNGENVQAKLPLLSTYMGHASIDSTYYYLTFIEGIREEASSRFYHQYGKELNIDDVQSSFLQNQQEINHAQKIHE